MNHASSCSQEEGVYPGVKMDSKLIQQKDGEGKHDPSTGGMIFGCVDILPSILLDTLLLPIDIIASN